MTGVQTCALPISLSLVRTLTLATLRLIVTCLAALPNLKQLGITDFHISDFCRFHDPNQSPLQPRAVLASLTSLCFHGGSDHLESLVAQIDTPMLQTLSITLRDLIHIPQLPQFISRAEKLKLPIRAIFVFDQQRFLLKLMPSDGFEFATSGYNSSSGYHDPSSKFRAMDSLCSELSLLLSHVERLDFSCNQLSPSTKKFMDPMLWLGLFRPFTAVRSLYVSKKVWPRVGPALQALIGERATEALPELRTLFLEEPFEYATKFIEPFIAARELAGHPVSIQPCITSEFVAEC